MRVPGNFFELARRLGISKQDLLKETWYNLSRANCTNGFFLHTSLKFVRMSYPSRRAVPSVMLKSPVNMLNVVVFPAPKNKGKFTF